MKKILFLITSLILTVILLFLFIPEKFQEYKSNHNFKTQVSDDWIIFTKNTIGTNTKELEEKAKDTFGMDKKLISDVKKSALELSHEYLFYKDKSSDIHDSITVFAASFEKENLSQKVTKFCEKLPEYLNSDPFVKIHLTLNYCKLQSINNIQTITYSYQNKDDNKKVKNIQYEFNTKTKRVGMGINCGYDKCDDIQEDAEKMIEKIEFL